MIYFKRQLDLPSLLQKKSFFLLGPRATGKSSLAKYQLGQKAIIFNLLKSDLYLKLSATPWELEPMIDLALSQQKADYVVIDEIQKVPHLLDEVQRLIEDRQLRAEECI